jgi:AraC-like DNA-binding protein
MKKSNDKGNILNDAEGVEIESGFYLLRNHNITDKIQVFTKEVDCEYIQIHFCLDESVKLLFNEGRYGIDIMASKSLLLYNPTQNLPINVELKPNARLISVLISIEKLHSFFTPEAGIIHFLRDENKNKKFYADKAISANESIVLSQITSHKILPTMEKLYLKAKIYELLSLYFQPKSDEPNKCPYLEEEENVEKIRQAKRIIIERMAEPPTLTELAKEINLPLAYLKDGFKQIYGDTVFNFLWEYKMEYARRMLDTKKYNVSEVSYEVGYSTASHFIAAFKKKFGITPKKYMGKI